MSTDNQRAKTLSWGLDPDRECVACWGARAIYEKTGGFIDLLWDRKSSDGPEHEKKRLYNWLDAEGLPLLRALVKSEMLQPDERRMLVIERPGFRLIANPNRSFGYLYIGAMTLKTNIP